MKPAKNGQWTEKHARDVLAMGEQRKLNNSELARELGVSPQRIHWWRKRLRGDAQTSNQPAFVEVKLAGPSATTTRPFAIRTRTGHTIEVWPGFDASELTRLLALVEKESC